MDTKSLSQGRAGTSLDMLDVSLSHVHEQEKRPKDAKAFLQLLQDFQLAETIIMNIAMILPEPQPFLWIDTGDPPPDSMKKIENPAHHTYTKQIQALERLDPEIVRRIQAINDTIQDLKDSLEGLCPEMLTIARRVTILRGF